jgi:prolyl oligopeptidase
MKSVLFALLVLGASCAVAAPADRFNAIVDAHWSWTLEQSPQLRTYLGDTGANDRWGDMSLAAHAQRDAQRADFLTQLEAVDVDALNEQQQLSHAMLLRRLRSERSEYALGLYLMPINMRSGPQHLHTLQERVTFNSERDYRDWLQRLQQLPQLLAEYRALLQEGIRQERTQARVVMERVPAQIDRLLAGEAEDSPFYKPFNSATAGLDEARMAELRREASVVIARGLNPALAEFREFLLATYLPACREQPGIGSLPEGKALYRFLAGYFTTTDMTPEAIHEVGKAEVARLLEEMEDVKRSVGFAGDLQAFNTFLRSDPQFYYNSPEALFEGYLAIAKRLDPQLVQLFGKLPRMPYGVRPIPDTIAPDTTTAYYSRPAANGTQPGYYYVNLYRPEVRPKYEMEVLSVHEAVPGHHLQIALAQELEGLPLFRTTGGETAFIEGWGLYAERLGYQMGLYTDPYSRYGQLTYDMWRAVRLVVDTGIHYFGWSRQEAIDYFTAHAGKSEADIVNEIDRYIGWPGQALAYKIGQLKILALRERAEDALGDAFDIRAFHDHLLGAGAIPLDALERRMDAWIANQRS